jgi:hypothetical protein
VGCLKVGGFERVRCNYWYSTVDIRIRLLACLTCIYLLQLYIRSTFHLTLLDTMLDTISDGAESARNIDRNNSRFTIKPFSSALISYT